MKRRREKMKWREEASRRWTKRREGTREEMKERECSVRKQPLADRFGNSKCSYMQVLIIYTYTSTGDWYSLVRNLANVSRNRRSPASGPYWNSRWESGWSYMGPEG